MGERGHLPLVSICILVSIYIVDCFKWGSRSFAFGIYSHWSLYILISLTVSNGRGGPFAFGIYVCIGLYIFL